MRKIARRLFSFKQKERIQKKDSFPKYSILLAEDNLLVLRAIKNLLEQQGYRVKAVEDGVQALSYLKSYTYKWALLDLVLPETDGIDLVQNYRDWEKETNKSYLPVFALTGYPFKSMERICKEAGIDFLFEKPFKIDDLKVIEDLIKALEKTKK
ncbi:response regulator [Rickettsiella endosymbiont of Dermanyssus gallinae]|uniref:response regulator n=1 Tax=Rickettsiella endosymbiont of Dermanyssus gallinae TaxID=2856608 RepID=UPI001C530D99|nr:response regulator [Rickettsiella endosymbiont of Dermanyssus gallinae]